MAFLAVFFQRHHLLAKWPFLPMWIDALTANSLTDYFQHGSPAFNRPRSRTFGFEDVFFVVEVWAGDAFSLKGFNPSS